MFCLSLTQRALLLERCCEGKFWVQKLFAQLPTPVQCPAGCPVRGAAGEDQDDGFGMLSSASSPPEPCSTEPFRSSITESPPA